MARRTRPTSSGPLGTRSASTRTSVPRRFGFCAQAKRASCGSRRAKQDAYYLAVRRKLLKNGLSNCAAAACCGSSCSHMECSAPICIKAWPVVGATDCWPLQYLHFLIFPPRVWRSWTVTCLRADMLPGCSPHISDMGCSGRSMLRRYKPLRMTLGHSLRLA